MTSSVERTDDQDPEPATPSSLTPADENDLPNFAVKHELPNGTSILIRAIRPDDKERLRAAFSNLETRSIYTRFFGYKKELTEAELDQATNVDFDRVVALVAVDGSCKTETIIAGARYVCDFRPGSPPAAEVAFTVEEDYRGRGIASCLLGHLVRIARGKGLRQFNADVLASNRPMLAVFAGSGLPMRQRNSDGVVRIRLDLVPSEASKAADSDRAAPAAAS